MKASHTYRLAHPLRATLISVVCNLLLATLAGCTAVTVGGEEPTGGPELVAVSTQELSIGESMSFYGGSFLHDKEQYTVLHFEGNFAASNGAVDAVDLRVRPHWVSGNEVVWAQVGPFQNPFSQSGQTGTFSGTVTALNVDGTGAEASSEPYPLELTFKDSLIIRSFEPVGAGCSGPVKRLLGGFPYRIEVEAVGFTPVNFTYTVAGEAQYDRPRIFRREATGQVDSFGDKGALVIAPVPPDVSFQLVNISVSARGTDGLERINSLVFAVHRPIEYVDSGTFKVAEILPAMPDSGCISGGASGRNVTYTESHTDTRTRTVGVNWSEAWAESSTDTKSLSKTVTKGISITQSGSKSTTTTQGWYSEWGWHADLTLGLEEEVNGSGGVPGVFEVGGSLKAKQSVETGVDHRWGKNGSISRAYSQGWAVGRDYSASDTESWAFARTRGYTLSKAKSDFWTVSSSDSKSMSMTGMVFPGNYGVFYRQPVRVALPGAIVAYNLCGEPSVVGEANFFDYSWSIDLAVGPTCPPYPESDLPEAQCLITPCAQE